MYGAVPADYVMFTLKTNILQAAQTFDTLIIATKSFFFKKSIRSVQF